MNWIIENIYTVKNHPFEEHTLTIVCDKQDLKREKVFWKIWGFSIIKKKKIDDKLLLLYVQKVDQKNS